MRNINKFKKKEVDSGIRKRKMYKRNEARTSEQIREVWERDR